MNAPKISFQLIAALLLVPPALCFSLDFAHPAVLSIFLTIIGFWLTEAVPLPVTGLLVPVLATLYGVLPADKAFESFGSDILFLFLGCFLMSRSMEKHGFDKRLAYFLLGRCMPGTSFRSISLVLALSSYTLSMWISNTSATAILAAVTLGILASLEPQIPHKETRQRVGVRLLLTCAFSASIGGLVTPVGSPPNLIAIKFLAAQGIDIGFFEWMLIGLPISLAMLVVLFLVFEFCFPVGKLNFPGIKKQFRELLKGLGPMKVGEIQIASIFVVTICLWIFPSILATIYPDNSVLTVLNSRLSMSMVGLSGGLMAFFLPVRDGKKISPNLSWSETDQLEWGTLMLFGGGLTLGVLLETSGAAKDISMALFGGHMPHPILIGALVVIASIIMSEFASNTAAASILIPLIIGATAARGSSTEVTTSIVLAATFGASFGFMLPVSTPPNAIVYGTKRVPAKDMRRAGIFFDVLGAAIIIVYMLILR